MLKAALHGALAPVGLLCYVLRIRFFDPALLNARIGHLAYEPDLYIKTGLIGWRRRYFTLFLSPGASAINPCLRDYWRPHIRVVRHQLAATLLRPLAWLTYLRPRYDFFPHLQLQARHRNQVFLAAQREYEKQFGGRPLLTLDARHRARGRAALAALGVPREAWFVCVHVRETGAAPGLPPTYRANLENAGQSFRDADIRNYVPAMQHVVRAGGWVIRLGDPSMTILPPAEGVIDYAHTDTRSDWMDVFLCAEARFFLGTTSGVFLVPFVFGKPCVLGNVVPLADAPLSSRDLYVLKRHYSERERRELTIDEICDLNLAEAYNSNAFASQETRVIQNSPEEILEATQQMLADIAGLGMVSDSDERRQRRFKELLRSRGRIPTAARLGRAFLERHERLLDELTVQPGVS